MLQSFDISSPKIECEIDISDEHSGKVYGIFDTISFYAENISLRLKSDIVNWTHTHRNKQFGGVPNLLAHFFFSVFDFL